MLLYSFLITLVLPGRDVKYLKTRRLTSKVHIYLKVHIGKFSQYSYCAIIYAFSVDKRTNHSSPGTTNFMSGFPFFLVCFLFFVVVGFRFTDSCHVH